MIKKRLIIFSACLSFLAILLCILGMNYVQASASSANSDLPVISNTVTKGKAGVMTVENEIKTALMPVGHCLYIFGGSWNDYGGTDMDIFADQGAGIEAMTIGVPQVWDNFYKSKDGTYDCWADEYMFMDDDWTTVVRPHVIHWGADCSGYMGWVLQNIINQEKGFGTEQDSIGVQPGWVCYAQDMGFALEHSKYGVFTKNQNAEELDPEEDPYDGEKIERTGDTDFRPGDIYTYGTGQKHVWMCLGICDDGSVLFVHCSEPGVFICGTVPSEGATSKASALSSEYMKRYYIDFYNKFGAPTRIGGKTADGKFTGYLKYSQFKWNDSEMTDPGSLRTMSAADVMNSIYCEDKATAALNSEGPVPTVYFNDALTDLASEANGQIIYNRESTSDATVNVHLILPAGYKFDSVNINGVQASGLDPQSNRANVTVSIADDYQIKTAASEIGASPTSETAQTFDLTYILIGICMILIISCGLIVFRKE